jgi:hypothetical protein
MDVPSSDFRVSDYLSPRNVHYIDDQYLTHATEGQKQPWLDWLQSQLLVKTRPKLYDPGRPYGSGRISEDFLSIIHGSTDNEWLKLLRNQYEHYVGDINSLHSELRQKTVYCFDGVRHEIRNVYLETSRVKPECVSRIWIPILKVEDPSDRRWQNMTQIGLRLRPDVQFYVTSLIKLKENWSVSTNLSTIDKMYKGIGDCFNEGPDYVK